MGGEKSKSGVVGLVGFIVVVLALAVMLLARYTFGGPGLSVTWPLLLVGLSVALFLAKYWELGIVFGGVFGVWLAANLGAFPLKKAWPFWLLFVILAAVVGFLRARSGQAPGPKSKVRD